MIPNHIYYVNAGSNDSKSLKNDNIGSKDSKKIMTILGLMIPNHIKMKKMALMIPKNTENTRSNDSKSYK